MYKTIQKDTTETKSQWRKQARLTGLFIYNKLFSHNIYKQLKNWERKKVRKKEHCEVGSSFPLEKSVKIVPHFLISSFPEKSVKLVPPFLISLFPGVFWYFYIFFDLEMPWPIELVEWMFHDLMCIYIYLTNVSDNRWFWIFSDHFLNFYTSLHSWCFGYSTSDNRVFSAIFTLSEVVGQ